MDVKKLALLVGALVIAVITAVMAKNMFAGAGAQQAAAAPAVPVGPKVLVAKKALPVGTIIDADAFAFQPWPKELMQSAYYLEGQPDVLGQLLRHLAVQDRRRAGGDGRPVGGPTAVLQRRSRWSARSDCRRTRKRTPRFARI